MNGNTSRDIHNGGWYWVSKKIIRDYVLRTGFLAMCVYHFLASMVDEKQTCFPSQKYIADHLGCSRSSVSRAVKKLVEQRLIAVTKEANQHALYHLLNVEKFPSATNVSLTRTSHNAVVDTNNTKISRSNNNIVNVQEKNTSNNSFQPKTKKELLALDIAIALNDKQNLRRYLSYTEQYSEEMLRTILSQVKQTPDQRIRKSRVALFTYLLHHYGEKHS